MKPIKLTMCAFGAYRDETAIDFSKFGNQGIFLITGDTGSGKTTIFDAICYALFGKASGMNRSDDTKILISDYADKTTKSYVELMFEHKGKVYKLLRTNQYYRKATNLTPVKPSAILEYDDTVIDSLRDVDSKIEEILGINENQFKHISMLAQGEFTKLLNSESNSRSEIFRRIFSTDIYKNIADKLNEKYRETRNLKDKLKTELNTVWSGTKLDEELNTDDITLIDKDLIISKLDDKIKSDEEKLKKLDEELKVLENNLNELSLKRQEQEKVNNAINEYENQEKIKKEYDSKKEEYDNLKVIIDKNQIAYEQIETLRSNKDSLEKQIKNLENNINEMQVEKNNLKEKFDAIQKEYNNVSKLKDEVKDKNEQLNLMKVEKDKILKIKTYNSNYIFAKEDFIEISTKYKTIKEEYSLVEEKFYNSQAGLLAQKLEEGKPCMVCGSIHHPNIAKLEESDISKDKLDSLREEKDKIQKEYVSKSEECSNLKNNIINLFKEIKEAEVIKENDIIKQLENGTLEEVIDYIYENKTTVIAKLIGEIDSLTQKYEQIEKEYNDIKLQLTTDETNIKSKIEQRDNLNKNLENAIIEYNKKLEFYKYKDEKDYLDILIEYDEYKNKTEEYNKYIQEYKEILNKIENLKDVIKDKKYIDLTLIENDINKDNDEKVNKKNLRDDINVEYKLNKDKIKEIKKKYDEYLKAVKSFNIYKELSDTATGNLTGKPKIVFEQYVQATYFDMILKEANKRLNLMTEGRFVLYRKENPDGLNDRDLLALEILDNNTGKKRSTKSLSGGESFKASLALALGLSDVIQNYSGGVSIDTMFIDEGFGSLDTESLEEALNTLNSLTKGNRLVGIISHVEILKDQIDKKLIVNKTKFGSQIRIEV